MDWKSRSYRILFGMVILGSFVYFAFILLKGYRSVTSDTVAIDDSPVELQEPLATLDDSVQAIETSISLENTLTAFEEDIFNYINEELDKLLEEGVAETDDTPPKQIEAKLMGIGEEAVRRLDEFKAANPLTIEQENRLNEIELYVNIQVVRDRGRSERLINAMENGYKKLAVIMSYLQAFAELEDHQILKDFALVSNDWASRLEGDYVSQVELLLFKTAPLGEDFPNYFKGQKSIAGISLDLERFQDKVILVDFWASWCTPCLQEFPYHKEVYYKYQDQGFEIIYINLDESRQVFLDTVEKYDLPWHHFFEDDGIQGEVARRYGVERLPTSYLIGSDGRVIGIDLKGTELRAQLKKLMAS